MKLSARKIRHPTLTHPRALDLNQIHYCRGRGASRKRAGWKREMRV